MLFIIFSGKMMTVEPKRKLKQVNYFFFEMANTFSLSMKITSFVTKFSALPTPPSESGIILFLFAGFQYSYVNLQYEQHSANIIIHPINRLFFFWYFNLFDFWMLNFP